MKADFPAQIDEIMARFDFQVVHRRMVAMRWTWRDKGVPIVPELKATARRLLEDLSRKPSSRFISSGGFRAGWYTHRKVLMLTFEVESYVAGEEDWL